MKDFDCIEIETTANPSSSVIWLHGLGADGNDFAPIIPELKLPEDMAVRFIFPNAPSIPVTINGGYVMPAWYDITEMSIERKVDTAQLLASADLVNELVEREHERGVAYENIVLAGFSQGGAVVYQAALSHPNKLAGLMTLSTYFATKDSIELSEANRDIPILICHGLHDPVVLPMLGEQAKVTLEAQGYRPEYRTYPMEHNVSYEEIKDISAWLQSVL